MADSTLKNGTSEHRRTFDARVYDLCRLIPVGRVTTYGWIAAAIDPPVGMEPFAFERIKPRWVGYALARCPGDVPWQRVINRQGGLSLKPGHEHQRALLEDEGVVFETSGRVNLERFGWKPNDA
ncbi:MAG: methyltransferase [Anaerolineales bacterium]|nr:MAG: methyltransferase [Anaerolineales bacterium]